MSHLTIRFEPTRLSSKKPAVLVPLETWTTIEDLLEDFEATQSKTLRRRIAKARIEKQKGKVHSFDHLP